AGGRGPVFPVTPPLLLFTFSLPKELRRDLRAEAAALSAE
ncbi:4-hydroxy-3-methylbut-2-enyl diphosphate reductase, partial [Streptomyces anulatus]